MTTQRNDQQEPSMEEILSSIRRIIADEADGEGEQDAGPQPDTLKRDADAPDPAADAAGSEDDVPFDADEDDGDDEDVLELTEVVREGAEIVELDVALAQPQAIEQHKGDPEAAADQAQDQAAPDEAEAEPAEEPLGEMPAFAAAPPADDHAAPSPMDDIRNDAMEEHETAMQTKQNGIDSPVSDQAAGAATGAFAKLSQRTPPEVAIADGNGRSVEQFAEDMMRPMLRDWLDQNLPAMVEQIVQREIRKMLRRGAEQD